MTSRMMAMSRVSIALAALATTSTAVADTPVRVGLRRAIALALSAEPDLRVETLELEERDNTIRHEASLFYYPRLVLDLGYLGEKLPQPTASLSGIVDHGLLAWRVGLEGRLPIGT